MRGGIILNNIIVFLLLISIGFYIRGGNATGQPPIQPPGLDIAIQVQEAHTPELLGLPEVVGTAVGLDDLGEPVIQVFTRSAGFRGIPSNIEGFPVEVIITGPFVALKGPPGSGGGGGGGSGTSCDKDGDLVPGNKGKCTGPDCNDNDPTIHPAFNHPELGPIPAATEYCDVKDNDCDNLVDEDCGPLPTPTPTAAPTPTPTPTPTPAPTPAPTPTPTPTPTACSSPPPAPPPSASECADWLGENRCERPIPIGVSLGNESLWCAAGTYGFRGIKNGQVVGVSNYHVIGMSVFGETISIGEAIMQPGLGDLWDCTDYVSNDRVGGLAAFVRIKFCSCDDTNCLNNQTNANVVDAAIFDPTLYNPTLINKLDNATPSDGYGMPRSNTISPEDALDAGGNVQKYGRTTSQTTGTITGINAAFDVQYPSGLCARFVNQIVIGTASFSEGGDSGSLIVFDGGCNDRKPVGLLFAGSDTGSFTVANPIDAVLTTLGITVDGQN